MTDGAWDRLLPRGNVIGTMLRAASMGAKFGLLIYLARWLGPEAVGRYGVLASSSGLAVFPLGLELHNWASREVASTTDHARRVEVVGQQATLYLATHLVGWAALAVAVAAGVVPWTWAAIFGVITASSHLVQEVHRMLVVLGRPNTAYALIALLTGGWVPVAVLGGLWRADLRSFEVVIASWAAFSVLSLGVALAALYRMRLLVAPARPNAELLRPALRTGGVYLLSSIAAMALETFDRLLVDHALGAVLLGVYTFVLSIVRVQRDLLTASVTIVAQPPMITAFASGDAPRGLALARQIRSRALVTWAATAPAFLAVTWFAASISHRAELAAWVPWAVVPLAANLVEVVSGADHLILYAQRQDRRVLFVHAASTVLGLAAIAILAMVWELPGALVGGLVAVATKAALRWVLVRRRAGDD